VGNILHEIDTEEGVMKEKEGVGEKETIPLQSMDNTPTTTVSNNLLRLRRFNSSDNCSTLQPSKPIHFKKTDRNQQQQNKQQHQQQRENNRPTIIDRKHNESRITSFQSKSTNNLSKSLPNTISRVKIENNINVRQDKRTPVYQAAPKNSVDVNTVTRLDQKQQNVIVATKLFNGTEKFVKKLVLSPEVSPLSTTLTLMVRNELLIGQLKGHDAELGEDEEKTKRERIVAWLVELGRHNIDRPKTPFIEEDAPTQTDTALHIVYAGD